jgi:hypothetical protein
MAGIDTGYGVFTLGKDYSIDLVDSTGDVLRFGNITDFDAKALTADLESNGIDGDIRYGVVPKGYELSWTMDRDSPFFERWVAANDAAYYGGGTIKNVTVNETIRESDGSISVYQFRGVALKPSDLGNIKATSLVTFKVSGKASRRVRLI